MIANEIRGSIQVDGLAQHTIKAIRCALRIARIRSHGEDRNGRRTRSLAQADTRFDAVHLRHPQIEENDVGLEVLGLGHGLAAIRRGADLKPQQREERTEEQSRVSAIVGHQNPDGRRGVADRTSLNHRCSFHVDRV